MCFLWQRKIAWTAGKDGSKRKEPHRIPRLETKSMSWPMYPRNRDRDERQCTRAYECQDVVSGKKRLAGGCDRQDLA